jgi:hypothetical protein
LRFMYIRAIVLDIMEQQPAPTTAPENQNENIPDLAFANADAISELRKLQNEAADKARDELLKGVSTTELFGAGMTQRERASDEQASAEVRKVYLDSHLSRDDNPSIYDGIAIILEETSPLKMSSERWELGEVDADGNHTRPETSGRAVVETNLDYIRKNAPKPAGDEPDHDPYVPLTNAERKAAADDLKKARLQLAELSIQRRQLIRKGSKKAKALEEQYNAVQGVYDERIKYLGCDELALMKLAAKNLGQSDKQTKTDLQARAVKLLLDEHQAFSRAEIDVLESDDSRKAKFARWLAGKGRNEALSFVAGAGIGIAAKAAKGSVALAVGVAAAPVTLGVAGALRVTKSIYTATTGNTVKLHREIGKRHEQDRKTIEAAAEKYLNASDGHEEVVNNSADILKGTLGDRVERDRKSNRNRVIAAVAFSGAGVAVGYELAEHAFGLGGHGGSHTPSHNGGTGNGGTPPAGAGSGDVPGSGSDGGTSGGVGGGSIDIAPTPGTVEGFNPTAHIANGEGFIQAMGNEATQHGAHLTDAQEYELYKHMQHTFPKGDFFTNEHAYRMADGNFGISRPGDAQWNPAALNEMNSWLTNNHLNTPDGDKTVQKAKAARNAAKAATALARSHMRLAA